YPTESRATGRTLAPAEYVQTLEEARDTAELPEASGEAIAREFERYLRRREPGAGPGPGVATEGGDSPFLLDPGSGRIRPPKPEQPGPESVPGSEPVQGSEPVPGTGAGETSGEAPQEDSAGGAADEGPTDEGPTGENPADGNPPGEDPEGPEDPEGGPGK
ncbi:hypothetical protein ACWDNT_34375, partial [Streptomyces sp. NPDC000963]